MIDYTLEHKPSFILSAYGFPVQASLQDYRTLLLEKELFEKTLRTDGRFDKLKKLAKNDREWSVNDDYYGKAWNYFAVETRKTVKDDSRLIKFPESDYILIAAIADKEAIFERLSHQAFRNILPAMTDYAYLGGSNAAYRQERGDGSYYGEFWLPVVKK
ncbi:MAG TPA: hypothetical protein DCZ00_00365 [Lactococcus sp.]|nr:hypothetical protein [Lactococcus sp.]